MTSPACLPRSLAMITSPLAGERCWRADRGWPALARNRRSRARRRHPAAC